MSYIFTPYPAVIYDPSGQSRPIISIDITRRFRIQEITKNNKLVYYDYDIKDRDRPDIMADKYYENPKLDWLFFITNQIFDPYFQWPLTYTQLTNYIRQKYGSVSNAQGSIHHYEQIVTQRKEYYSNYDGSTITIPESVVQVDYTTYASLDAANRRQVSDFDFEESENNRKRKIKILDKVFVPEIMRDFRRIFE